MKSIKKIPDVPQIGNCEKHGQFEYRYMEMMPGKVWVSASCPECANEQTKLSAIKAVEEKEAEDKKRDDEMKLRRGISRRNLNVQFDDFTQELPNQIHAVNVMKNLGKNVFEGKETPSVIMTGKVGTGKTMLACACLSRFTWRHTCEIIKLIDLVRSLKETWSQSCQRTERDIIEYYSNLDLLVIDEVGMQFGSDTEKMFIFDVIDGRYEAMKPTVLISNLEIDGIVSVIGERALDRLRDGGGEILTFDWGSARR